MSTTSLFWIEKAGGYFSVQPLPRFGLFARLKSSRKVLPGARILNVWLFDVPPPGAGLKTVTVAVPVAAMSEAAMRAVNWVDETNEVARSVPFHRTNELDTKPFPLTVNVNPGAPAIPELGMMEVVAGIGLLPPPSKLLRVKLSNV